MREARNKVEGDTRAPSILRCRPRHPLHHHDPAAEAVVTAMEALRQEELTVESLQDRFAKLKAGSGAVQPV